jgi:hypothetical protein
VGKSWEHSNKVILFLPRKKMSHFFPAIFSLHFLFCYISSLSLSLSPPMLYCLIYIKQITVNKIYRPIKSSREHSRVNWLQEEADGSGTISVPIIRVVMWLDTPSVPSTYLRLCAREEFTEFSRREGFKLYKIYRVFVFTRRTQSIEGAGMTFWKLGCFLCICRYILYN